MKIFRFETYDYQSFLMSSIRLLQYGIIVFSLTAFEEHHVFYLFIVPLYEYAYLFYSLYGPTIPELQWGLFWVFYN